MAGSSPQTPDEYIASLPPDRREARADLDRYLAHYRSARGPSRATRSATKG